MPKARIATHLLETPTSQQSLTPMQPRSISPQMRLSQGWIDAVQHGATHGNPWRTLRILKNTLSYALRSSRCSVPTQMDPSAPRVHLLTSSARATDTGSPSVHRLGKGASKMKLPHYTPLLVINILRTTDERPPLGSGKPNPAIGRSKCTPHHHTLCSDSMSKKNHNTTISSRDRLEPATGKNKASEGKLELKPPPVRSLSPAKAGLTGQRREG